LLRELQFLLSFKIGYYLILNGEGNFEFLSPSGVTYFLSLHFIALIDFGLDGGRDLFESFGRGVFLPDELSVALLKSFDFMLFLTD
jgi:hypothetical protein